MKNCVVLPGLSVGMGWDPRLVWDGTHVSWDGTLGQPWACSWECHSYGNPMGNVPWDGIGRNRHKLLWDGNGTDKYVPWLTLCITVLQHMATLLNNTNAVSKP